MRHLCLSEGLFDVNNDAIETEEQIELFRKLFPQMDQDEYMTSWYDKEFHIDIKHPNHLNLFAVNKIKWDGNAVSKFFNKAGGTIVFDFPCTLSIDIKGDAVFNNVNILYNLDAFDKYDGVRISGGLLYIGEGSKKITLNNCNLGAKDKLINGKFISQVFIYASDEIDINNSRIYAQSFGCKGGRTLGSLNNRPEVINIKNIEFSNETRSIDSWATLTIPASKQDALDALFKEEYGDDVLIYEKKLIVPIDKLASALNFPIDIFKHYKTVGLCNNISHYKAKKSNSGYEYKCTIKGTNCELNPMFQ